MIFKHICFHIVFTKLKNSPNKTYFNYTYYSNPLQINYLLKRHEINKKLGRIKIKPNKLG